MNFGPVSSKNFCTLINRIHETFVIFFTSMSFSLSVNFQLSTIRLIPKGTVDNNLVPDRLAGPKALDPNFKIPVKLS